MKRVNPIAKTIDGVRVLVTPGKLPEFMFPKMSGNAVFEWKTRNASAVNKFIKSVDPIILESLSVRKMSHTRKKKFEQKQRANNSIGDYTPKDNRQYN